MIWNIGSYWFILDQDWIVGEHGAYMEPGGVELVRQVLNRYTDVCSDVSSSYMRHKQAFHSLDSVVSYDIMLRVNPFHADAQG